MKQRLWVALSAYAVIAVVAYLTLPDTFYVERFGRVPMSYPVIAFLALLAFKSYVHRHHTMRGAQGKRAESEGRE